MRIFGLSLLLLAGCVASPPGTDAPPAPQASNDVRVQIELGVILGLEDRPSEKAIRALAEPWRPHRGAAAIFAWHHRRMD